MRRTDVDAWNHCALHVDVRYGESVLYRDPHYVSNQTRCHDLLRERSSPLSENGDRQKESPRIFMFSLVRIVVFR